MKPIKINRIGIVGSGHIGGNLGILLAKAGYEIFYSSRHPDTLKNLVKSAGPKARAGTVADAIAFGDVIVLSLPLKAIPELGAETKEALKGKIVIDTSNPYPERDGVIAEEARKEPRGMGAFVADSRRRPGRVESCERARGACGSRPCYRGRLEHIKIVRCGNSGVCNERPGTRDQRTITLKTCRCKACGLACPRRWLFRQEVGHGYTF
jgi:hypothetical protein